jgi:hypothetical protein
MKGRQYKLAERIEAKASTGTNADTGAQTELIAESIRSRQAKPTSFQLGVDFEILSKVCRP